eukprot:TRINITY_DN1889_c0_g3_i1.p1 TRINITY_DN1889_c0_g3~~TRINITY_DN1889_c0_g3_i1.p1  ORF type:complete len:287 (+),score=71.90 TRINITY_DN1889_c0_g3_i1:80-940(+)
MRQAARRCRAGLRRRGAAAAAERQRPPDSVAEQLGFVLPPLPPGAPRRLVVSLDLHETLVRVRPLAAESPPDADTVRPRGAPPEALADGWEQLRDEAAEDAAGAESVHALRSPCGAEWEVLVRPGCGALLQLVGERCEGVLWTVGGCQYVTPVAEWIDPTRALTIVMSTASRYDAAGNSVGLSDWALLPCCKPLAMLHRDPGCVLQIDDRPEYLRCNPGNRLVVPPYWGKRDAVLHTVRDVVRSLADAVNQGASVPDALAALTIAGVQPLPEGGAAVEKQTNVTPA